MLDVRISPPARATRADALCNRKRIIAAAKECFLSQSAGTAMEDIARRAGVGVGSLYRGFGSRAGLAEAVFRDMLDELGEFATHEEHNNNPLAGLVGWIDSFVDKLIEKRAMLTELKPLFEHDPQLLAQSHQVASTALDQLLKRAQTADCVRRDVNAPDLFQLIIGMVTAGGGERSRIEPLMRIVLQGLRAQPAA